MDESTFAFLKDEFEDIYEECNTMEKSIINKNFEYSIMKARKAIEVILDKIYDLENISNSKPSDLNMKIITLLRKHIIDFKISDDLHKIRKAGNLAVHNNGDIVLKTSFEIHQHLFNVAKFFYLKYTESLTPNDIGTYTGVTMAPKNDLQDILNRLKELEGQINPTEKNNPDNDTSPKINNLENYEYVKINGSFLNGELYRLKNSSQESVEGYENLSEFKNYLHVDRDIQDELYHKISDAVNYTSNKLILLCGSVGDGKSHLLAYFNQKYPELMKKFETINDATESSDPNKTSIDRLANKLSDFNDENINKTNTKILLLINLGVLNNFIDSEYAKTNYTKLSDILNDLNIFDVNDFSDNFDKDPISIISFSDNNLFEFNVDHIYNVYSKYMSELFSRVTNHSENNPFYNAYKKDLKNNFNSPIIYNYTLFSLEKVQDIIIDNLIKIIIKYKKIISTRELLNFIYEIIVPSQFIEYNENDTLLSYLNDLLPNLFFNTTDRCEILKYINYEDPVLKRSETIDQLLLELNVSDNTNEILEKYMELDDLNIFKRSLDSNIIIKNLDQKERKTFITTIIRFLNIFGKPEIINLFTKESYKNYVEYLMNYNKGNIRSLRHLKTEIENAIFHWKGKIQDNYICVENLEKFKIAKQFDIKLQGIDNEIKERNINRFKTSIHLKFTINNSKTIDLNLDYSLYEVITKLNKGYKPNKSEQKDLLLFNEFIDKLINSSKTEDYLVYNILENKKFKLKNDFGYYVFERA